MKKTCEKEVWNRHAFRSRPCGKPAKGELKNGTPVCGIHLRQEKQREESEKAYKEDMKRREKYIEEVAKLKEKYGLKTVGFRDPVKRTVSIDIDELDNTLGELFASLEEMGENNE